MYYSTIKNFDISNGDGIRVSLFVSGCHIHCKGCFNQEAWSFTNGTEFTIKTLDYLNKLISNENISGLSILGGEPMSIENQETIYSIISDIKEKHKNKDIWLWTGYYIKDIPHTRYTNKILDKLDVIIEGPFIEEEKDLRLLYRGSKNQNIIRK